MTKRGGFGIGTGGASILVIFVLLCITTFATLSIVSANADYKLSRRNAQAVEDYYAADAQANGLLAGIDLSLRTAPGTGTVAQRCQTALEELAPALSVEAQGEGALVRYAVPMRGDTREVRVTLMVTDSANGLKWKIAGWQSATTQEWVENDSIQLWDGGATMTDGGGLAGLPEGPAPLPEGPAPLPEGLAP